MALVNTLIKLGFSNTLVTLFLCILLLLALALYLHYKFYVYDDRFMELASKIPGPKWYPFIGSAYGFGTDPPSNFERLTNLFSGYNHPVSKIWLGPLLYISIKNVKDVEAILLNTTLLTKASVYKLMGPLSEGLLGNSGETWKRHRKAVRPGFSFHAMEDYIKIFNSKSRILVEVLESHNGKDRVSICNFLNNYYYDTTYNALFSTESNEQTNTFEKSSDMSNKMEEIGVVMMQRMLKPWLYPDSVFYMTPQGKKYMRDVSYLLNHVKEVVREKKEILKSKSTGQGLKDTKSDSKSKHRFLNHLMENVMGKDLTEDEVVMEIATMMVAGLETSNAMICTLLTILSRRFDIQEKIVEEIQQVLGTTEENDITAEDVRNLTYLDRVYKETMRVLTVVPFFGREMTQEFTLPSGYTLPKGCTVIIPGGLLHRDPKIYPNPHIFDPDHFLPERVAARSPYSYIPFSCGPRDCIGKKFAELEIKIALINILRRFWITPTADILMMSVRIILYPIRGPFVGLRTRTPDRPVIAGSEEFSKMLPTNIKWLNFYFKDSYN